MDLVGLVCGAAFLGSIYSCLMVALYIRWGVSFPASKGYGIGLMDWINLLATPYSIRWWLLSGFFEEVLIRFPLGVVALFWRKWLGAAVVLSSLVFGLGHGLIMVPIHGPVAIILAFVFLKCGGASGHLANGLLASTVSHFMLNMSVLYIVGPPMFRVLLP